MGFLAHLFISYCASLSKVRYLSFLEVFEWLATKSTSQTKVIMSSSSSLSLSSSSSSSRSSNSVPEGLVGSHEDSSSSHTLVVRASDANVVENSSSGAMLSDPPLKTGYDWINSLVAKQSSKYRWLESLEYFVASVPMVTPGTEEGMTSIRHVRSLTVSAMTKKGVSQISSTCMGVSLLTPMSTFPLTSSPWVRCVFQCCPYPTTS